AHRSGSRAAVVAASARPGSTTQARRPVPWSASQESGGSQPSVTIPLAPCLSGSAGVPGTASPAGELVAQVVLADLARRGQREGPGDQPAGRDLLRGQPFAAVIGELGGQALAADVGLVGRADRRADDLAVV